MCEVEAIGPVSMELQKAWRYYRIIQVDGLATNVAVSFQDESGLVRND